MQFFGARKAGLNYLPIFDLRHPDLKKYVLLTLPLMIGLTMTFSTEFFFRLFGSYLAEGSIAVLNFGLRIMLILVGAVWPGGGCRIISLYGQIGGGKENG